MELETAITRVAEAGAIDRSIRPADALADAGIDDLAIADPTGVTTGAQEPVSD